MLPVVSNAANVPAHLRQALLCHVPSVRPDHLPRHAALVPALPTLKAFETLTVQPHDLTVACGDLSDVHIDTNGYSVVNSFHFVRRDLVSNDRVPSSAFTLDGHRAGFVVTVRVFTFAGETEPAKFLQPDVLPGKFEMTWFGKRHRSCSILRLVVRTAALFLEIPLPCTGLVLERMPNSAERQCL